MRRKIIGGYPRDNKNKFVNRRNVVPDYDDMDIHV